MPVDRRFDFLRIHLQAADVDEAAPSTEEVVPLAAAFHHVAGVDEAVCIGERGAFLTEIPNCIPRGPDPQRPIIDADLDIAGRADQARRKSFEPIGDVESHARLRGGEGMADTGLRVERTERVKNRLVRDFSR